MDRVPSGLRGDVITWHAIDLRDSDAAAALVRDVSPSSIVNAAWDTRHGTYWTSDENALWAESAKAMLLASGNARSGVRFVQIGTCAEYQWEDIPLAETRTLQHPATPYGRAKLSVHRALAEATERGAISGVTARLFFPFGPHENDRRLIPSLCRALIRGTSYSIENPCQIRDFLPVADAARAILGLAGAAKATGAVNIASGRGLALREIGEGLERLAGNAGVIRYGTRSPRRGDRVIAAVSKLADLSLTGQTPLWQALAETFSWWRAHS